MLTSNPENSKEAVCQLPLQSSVQGPPPGRQARRVEMYPKHPIHTELSVTVSFPRITPSLIVPRSSVLFSNI